MIRGKDWDQEGLDFPEKFRSPGVRFYLSGIFATGNDTGGKWILQAPRECPLTHRDANRDLSLAQAFDFRQIPLHFLRIERCANIGSGENCARSEFAS